MSSMTTVPRSTRLGKEAQSEIRSRLSSLSIVNELEHDVGLDFYCQLLMDNSPSTPFYVQAKGTEHFNEIYSRSVKKSTISLWLEQNFPVFIIVYDRKDDACYWMSIEDSRYSLLEKIRTNRYTINIKINKSNTLKKGEGMNDEFTRKIEEDSRSIALWLGHPQPIGRGYTKKIPEPPRSEGELLRTKEQIRMNMYSLIRHFLRNNDYNNAYLYSEFLTKIDKSHYNHFVLLGILNKRRGYKETAKENLIEALAICERDKKWPTEHMDKIKTRIKNIIEDS